MSIEPFTALAGFATLLEAVLASVLLVGVGRAFRARRADAGHAPGVGDDSVALLAGPASVLVVLSVVAWPLLYLLLQSQVPRWVGVMCIQGVLRVGAGSEGAAGLLPSLLSGLQVTKPAVLFAAGAWLALHRLDRGTRTAPLAPRVLAALAVLAGVALVDAGLEATWLAIPKREQALAVGCCTFRAPETTSGIVAALLANVPPGAQGDVLSIGSATLVALLGIGTFDMERRLARGGALPLGAALATAAVGLVWVPTSLAYAARIAAPVLLEAPEHACVYCLLARVPLSGIALGASMLGTFALGWTTVLLLWGRHAETVDALRRSARSWAILALVALAVAWLLAVLARATL